MRGQWYAVGLPHREETCSPLRQRRNHIGSPLQSTEGSMHGVQHHSTILVGCEPGALAATGGVRVVGGWVTIVGAVTKDNATPCPFHALTCPSPHQLLGNT